MDNGESAVATYGFGGVRPGRRSHYWGVGDASSKSSGLVQQAGHLAPTQPGIDGSLFDLEYQRIEVIRFNLFDHDGTYKVFITGRDGVGGPAFKVWKPVDLHVGGDGEQTCEGDIRHRNVTGICNDILNPLMGSTKQPFARNVAPIPRSPTRAEPRGPKP